MKAAILTLALAIFMLGASATYVKSQGGFSCRGEIDFSAGGYSYGGPMDAEITLSCG